MLERTINNAPTSNTKQAAMNGDMQHMLAMMQNEQTQQAAANAAKAGDMNHAIAMLENKSTYTTPAVPLTPKSTAAVQENTVAAPAITQTSAPATTQATTTQTTQAAQPTITVSAPSVNSHKAYIDDLYAAQREAALSALEAEYTAAIGELERQKAAIAPAYQSARNQTAGVNAQESRAMNEMFNAAGLSSGGRAQGAIAQSNVLQSELGALQQAETQALAEIESQRTQVAAQYQAKVREAIMNNEMEKAAALYDEAIRYDNAMTSAAKEDAKLKLEMQKSDAELRAGFGDFSGYASLYGWTPEQLAEYEAAYIEATKPKYSGGGGTPVVKEPTLSLAEAKALAAEGDLSANVLATLYANGWTDANINAMYGKPTPTPTPTPTTQQTSSDTVVTTPANKATPVGENPYGSILKNVAAQNLYASFTTGYVSADDAVNRAIEYMNKNAITPDEANYIVNKAGY